MRSVVSFFPERTHLAHPSLSVSLSFGLFAACPHGSQSRRHLQFPRRFFSLAALGELGSLCPAADQLMGLDYSYELIAERHLANCLVRAVSEHLAPDDKARLLGALDLGVDDLMEQIQRSDLERGSQNICLSFLFAADEHLAEYEKDWPLAPVDGRVQVGCVWTSIECGSRFVLLRATAATSGMSRLFERSASVQETFSDIGRSGGALLVAFDDEREDFVSVWPLRGRFATSKEPDCYYDEDLNLTVDEYCGDLIASARRALDGQSAETGA